tara:strand:- start:2000 stop:2659 length:660 start_codon:yes stop_codon:yes gene_type:complete
MERVSVIIPTYNRFKFLIHNLQFIKKQSYSNFEIIIINDCSTEKEYYTHNWENEGVIIIHLPENSKKIFGYGCVGYVRNIGIEKASGKYIAFCDDDDTWLPNKLELQINAMMSTGCKMSSTETVVGRRGLYNPSHKYNEKLIGNKQKIWTLDHIKKHNWFTNSSVVVEKDILIKAGKVPHDRRGQDYEAWKKCLEYTNSVYVNEALCYYDGNHGFGSNH